MQTWGDTASAASCYWPATVRTVREKGVNVCLRGDMGLTSWGAPGGTGVPLYCKSHLHIFSQKFGGPGVASSRGSVGGVRFFRPIPYVYVFFSSFYHFSSF